MIKVISNLWLFGWIQSSLSIPENPICNSAINIAIMHFYPYRGSINEAMKLCVPCFTTRKQMISQNYESTKNTCKHTIKTHAHQQKTLLIMASIRSSGCKMPFFFTAFVTGPLHRFGLVTQTLLKAERLRQLCITINRQRLTFVKDFDFTIPSIARRGQLLQQVRRLEGYEWTKAAYHYWLTAAAPIFSLVKNQDNACTHVRSQQKSKPQ